MSETWIILGATSSMAREFIRVDLTNVPAGHDYDIYLYKGEADCNARTNALARSINGRGMDDSFAWGERFGVDDGGSSVDPDHAAGTELGGDDGQDPRTASDVDDGVAFLDLEHLGDQSRDRGGLEGLVADIKADRLLTEGGYGFGAVRQRQ